MIEGLKVQFSTEEFKAHLLARAKHHEERANWYHSQADQFEDAAMHMPGSNVSNSPKQSLQGSEKVHRAKSATFLVMAEHLIPNETYRLDERDLEQVELIPKGLGY